MYDAKPQEWFRAPQYHFNALTAVIISQRINLYEWQSMYFLNHSDITAVSAGLC